MIERVFIRGWFIAALVVSANLFFTTTHATEWLPLSLNKTIRQSESIFLGTVTDQQPRWGDESQRWMVTDYSFVVEDAIYGSIPGDKTNKTIMLTYWGGTIDGETQGISDMRVPVVGERLIVMLRQGWQTEAGFTEVVGFNEGLFAVSTESSGEEFVRDYAGRILAFTRQGQVLREHDITATAEPTQNTSLVIFSNWVRDNVEKIKNEPTEISLPSTDTDPRIRALYAKQPLIKNNPKRITIPNRVTMTLAAPDDAKSPDAPVVPAGNVLGGPTDAEVEHGHGEHQLLFENQPDYNGEYLASVPIIVNNFPDSFGPWSPEDEYQMSQWNYYASNVFRVFTTPTSTYSWPDGVFDLAGWPSSAELQAVYGQPWGATTLGITFLRFSGISLLEADIALNPAYSWTLDDEWVVDGSTAHSFRRTMTHELGHMFGLGHNFFALSVMNYGPSWYRGFQTIPTMDDAEAIRSMYSGNLVSVTDLGVYLFHSTGDKVITEADIPASVVAGENLTFNNYQVENAGTTTIDTPTIEWYLTSARDFVSPFYYLGEETYGPALPRFTHYTSSTVSLTYTVPESVPPGDYYLTAFIRDDAGPGQTSFPVDNNRAFSRNTIIVLASSGGPDIHEPDDSSAAANTIVPGITQQHSIFPAGDEDWMTFMLTTSSEITLGTSGSAGDTRLWLYDENLVQLYFDDDGGSGTFSLINVACDPTPLPAGNYFIKVNEFSASAELDAYNIDLSATECPEPVGPDIRITPRSVSLMAPAVPAEPITNIISATSINSRRAYSDADRTVLLDGRSVDPQTTVNFIGQPELAGSGRQYMLMQFETIPTLEEKRQLERSGIKLLGYLPNQTYRVRVEDFSTAMVTSVAGGVRWAWAPAADDKLSDRAKAGNFPPGSRHEDGAVSVYVRFAEASDYQDVQDIILASSTGAAVVQKIGERLFEIRVDENLLANLAALNEITWVQPAPPPPVTHNVVAQQRIKVDTLQALPLELTGGPVVVGVWDEGAVDAHTDFGSRLTVVDTGATVSNHSTHVAGTVGGSGAGDSLAEGMAPGVSLHSYDWNSDSLEMRSAAIENTAVNISNHSYGIPYGWTWDGSWQNNGTIGFGQYDAQASDWDDLVFDTGLLVFKSAGNDRGEGPTCPLGPDCDGPFDTISTYGNAKNIITICALGDSDQMTSFSSWGPSDDARVKPDLCANGNNLYSTWPGNSYNSISGTSMSSPSAAGAGALLLEHYANETGDFPQAATMKALLIHGADDLGRTGPDYEFGWGIINTQESADLISTSFFAEGLIASNGSQRAYTLNLNGDEPDLRVTLAWTDVAGDPMAAKALVNDLDLLVVGPNGTEYEPWVLNGAAPADPAVTGVNSVDNVEQVVVSNPIAGNWTLLVDGALVPLGPQSFSLIGVSGNTRVINIQNIGDTVLQINDIQPTTAAPWISVSSTSFSVAPGTMYPVEIVIDFAAAPAGTTVTELSVSSNDPDGNPFPDGVLVTVNNIAATDTDNDGIPDDADNCTLIENPDQLDTDGDGFGNLCDADLDNSGIVNFGDLAAFRTAFGTADPDADLNGSGVVNFADLAIFRSLFGQVPGPSGLVP